MKLKSFLLIVLLSSGSLFAQTKKGNIFVSGGTGLQFIGSNNKIIYDGKTVDSETQNTLSISPSGAYFVIDNLAVGLNSNITNTTIVYESGDKESVTTSTLLPTAVYFFQLEGKIRPLAQIGAGFMKYTIKDIPKIGSNDVNSLSGICFSFGGGIAYFIKENISFNFGLSYTTANLTDVDDSKTKMRQGNFSSNIGISIYF